MDSNPTSNNILMEVNINNIEGSSQDANIKEITGSVGAPELTTAAEEENERTSICLAHIEQIRRDLKTLKENVGKLQQIKQTISYLLERENESSFATVDVPQPASMQQQKFSDEAYEDSTWV